MREVPRVVALMIAALVVCACSRHDHASKRKALENAKTDSQRNQQAIQNTLNALRRESAKSPSPSATP